MDFNSGASEQPSGLSGNVVSPSAVFDFEADGNGSARGSDSGNGGGGNDPSAPYGRNKDGSPRQRRGRKPGSGASAGAGNSKGKNLPAVDAIAGTLYSIHGMVATFAHIPELQLSETEAQQIAKVSAQLAETYDFGIDPRAMAWSNLILVIGSVYGPRALGIYLRLKNERESAKKAG